MVYTLFSAVVVLIALVALWLALKLVFRGSWFVAWLRGCSGLLLIALVCLLMMSALDLYSYKQLVNEQTVATVSFVKEKSQQFKVTLVNESGIEVSYPLKGDMWQLDARIIRWNDVVARLGVAPGYRLDRLSGRYYSLEQERSAERTVYSISTSQSMLDLWEWLRSHGESLNIVDADYGSATYLPMEDGALFAVTMNSTGMIARPLNDRAKVAIERWQ